jgi:hypothetical protein
MLLFAAVAAMGAGLHASAGFLGAGRRSARWHGPGVSVPVCLVAPMPAPAVTVVGDELLGHRHVAASP